MKGEEFKIGHSQASSETFIPHFHKDKEQNVVYADVAGLLDTGTKNMQILNSFILLYLFKIAKKVRFVMAIQYQLVTEARGQLLRQ